jgi:hypothetical protein
MSKIVLNSEEFSKISTFGIKKNRKQKYSPNLPKKLPNCFKIDSLPSRRLFAMFLDLKSSKDNRI